MNYRNVDRKSVECVYEASMAETKPDNPPPQQFAPDGTVIPLSECQAVVPFAVTLTPEHFRGIMIRVLVLIYQKITAQSAIALPFHVSQLIEAKLKTAHQHWQSGRAKECSTGIKEASKLICKALGGALVPPAQAKTWAEIIDFLGIPEPSYLECMNMLALLAESTGDDAKKWVVPVHPTTGEAVEWQYQEIQRTSPGQGIWVLDQKHSKQIANLEQSHSEEMTGLKHQHSKEMEDMEERMEQKYSQQMSKMEQRLEQLLALAMAKEGNRTQTATPQATQQEGADGRMRPGHQSQVETERDDQEKTPYESETAGVEECLQGSKEDPKLEQSYKQEPQEEVDQSRSKVQVPSENVGPDSSQKEVVPQSSLEKQDAGETRTEGDVRRHDSQEEHPPLHRNDLQSHKEAQNTEKEEIASPRDQQSEGSVQSVEGSSESLPIPCQNELQREENDHQQKSLEQGKEVQTSSAGRAGPKSSRGEETPSKERKKVDSPPKESSWGQALSYLIPSQLRQIILQEQEHNEEAGLERNEAVRESSLPSSSEPPPTQPDEAQSKDSEQKDNACGESDESSTKPTPKLEKRESQPQGKKEESEDHQEGEVHHKEVESSWGQALSYLIRGSDEPKPKPQIEGESQPQEQREPQPEEKKEESEDHEVHHKEVGSSWGQALSYLIRGSDEPKPKPQIEGESQPQEQREPQPEEKKEESEDHEVHHKEVGSSWGQALSYLIRGSDEPKPKPQIEGESQPQKQRESQPEERKEESEDHEVRHKEVESSWGQTLSYLIPSQLRQRVLHEHEDKDTEKPKTDDPPRPPSESAEAENKNEKTKSNWSPLLTYGLPVAAICFGGVVGAGLGATALAGTALAAKVGGIAVAAKVVGVAGVGKVGAGAVGGAVGGGGLGVMDYFSKRKPDHKEEEEEEEEEGETEEELETETGSEKKSDPEKKKAD